MSKPLQCPQCGASDCTLIEDNRYHCNFCGSIFIYGNANKFQQQEIPVYEAYNNTGTQKTPASGNKITGCFIGLVIMLVAGIAVFISKSHSSGSAIFKKGYSEFNSDFVVVNTDKGAQVWTASTRNMDGSDEEKYFLNQLNPAKKEPLNAILIGSVTSTISTEKEANKIKHLKYFGNTCYAIIGDNKLLGYDVNSQEQVLNNDLICANFSELKSGIAKIDDVYDLDGFKFTTKDGFTFYFVPKASLDKNAGVRTIGKLLTEKEYNKRNSKETIDTDKEVTEYCFTKGERQQLYLIKRKTGVLFKDKLTPNNLSDAINNDNIDNNWYLKSYKIISTEEFTPNKIYFNATVLYSDSDEIIILFQNEAGDNPDVAITVQCINADKTVRWTKTGEEIEPFKKLVKSINCTSLKSGNEIAVMQPYVTAISINDSDGKINWTFKPY
jgi:hypothetical protein